MVGEFHHPRDRGVEGHRPRVFGDGLDRFVQQTTGFLVGIFVGFSVGDRGGQAVVVGILVDDQPPDAVEEVSHAGDALHRPRLGRLQRSHEHLVQTKAVGTVVFDDVVRVDDVAAGLGHLHRFAVRAGFAQDHALVDQSAERFGRADVAAVVQDLVPEPRVQQVQHGVFGPADIKIDRHPRPLLFRIDQRRVVVGVDVAEVVPAGPGPLGHRVGFAAVSPAVDRDVQPIVVGFGQRPLGAARGFEVFQVRQRHRQIVDGDRTTDAGRFIVVIDFVGDGERFAPKPLAAE